VYNYIGLEPHWI